jgi:ferredoxin
MLRVRVDAQLCVGHGRCYALAPAVFQEDDAGRGVVVAACVKDALGDQVKRAQESCPEGAIKAEALADRGPREADGARFDSGGSGPATERPA